MKKIFTIVFISTGIFSNAEDNNFNTLSPTNNVPEMRSLIGIGGLPPCEKISNNYNMIDTDDVSISNVSQGSIDNNQKLSAPHQSILGLSCTPPPSGKDFAGPFYIKDGRNLITFREVAGRMEFDRFVPAPSDGDALLRSGSWWKRRGREVLQYDPSSRGWFPRFTAPGDFLAFDVTFDEHFVLFGLQDEKHREVADIQLFSDEKSSRTLLEKFDRPYPSTLMKIMDARDLVMAVHEEYHLYYYPNSGQAFWFDGAEKRLRTLEIPWAEPPGERRGDKEPPPPPRCLAWIPTVDGGMVLIYDNRSRFSAAEQEAHIQALRKTGRFQAPAPEWKALRLGLANRDWKALEVPEGLKFPLWSLDGSEFIPLQEVPVRLRDLPTRPGEVRTESKKPDGLRLP